MEEQPGLKSEEAAFRSQHNNKLSSYRNGKWENMSLMSKASRHSPAIAMESRPCSSIREQCLDIPKSPTHAMEFLCRSWSPHASDFQQLLSASNLFLPLNAIEMTDEHDERKVEETLENQAKSSRHITNKRGFTRMKGWLKGKPSITDLFRSRRENKEQVRYQTAKLHATLSLTQLAAAIAGFATRSSTEAQDIKDMTSSTGAGTLLVAGGDQDMGVVVASAAALLAAVCAEAAESLGATRARVASAVKSGLATQTPIDMITLTATAATCLRGAATLKSRAKTNIDVPMNRDLLKVGAHISIVMPSGDRQYQWVAIYPERRQITLSFRQKYLGGTLTATKEYKVINAIEESKDIKGVYFLSLKTNKGIIKLLFEDEKQSIIWISTISNLLQMHNTC